MNANSVSFSRRRSRESHNLNVHPVFGVDNGEYGIQMISGVVRTLNLDREPMVGPVEESVVGDVSLIQRLGKSALRWVHFQHHVRRHWQSHDLPLANNPRFKNERKTSV